MKSKKAIKQMIRRIERQDSKCMVTAHKEGRTCFDAGHGIHGTYIAVLNWVLNKKNEDIFDSYEKQDGKARGKT